MEKLLQGAMENVNESTSLDMDLGAQARSATRKIMKRMKRANNLTHSDDDSDLDSSKVGMYLCMYNIIYIIII